MNIEEMEAWLYENYPNLSNEELSNLYNEFIWMIWKSWDDMNWNNIDPNITRVENKIDREKCKKVIEEYIRRKNPIKEDDPQKVEPIEGDSKHTNTISEDAQQKEEQKIEWEIMKEIFSCFQKGIFKSPIIRKKVLYENEETPKSWETKYFSTYRKLMRFIESLERKEKPNLDHVLSVFKNHLSEILKNYKDTIKTMHPKVEYKWLEDLKWVDGLVKKMRPYVEDILPKNEEKKDNKSKKKAKREKTKTKENNIQENGEKKENTYDYVKNMYIPKEIQKIIYDNYKEIIFDEKGKNNFVENCRKEGIIPTIRRKIKKDLRRTILKEGRNIEYYENIDYENVYYSPDVLRYKKWLCIHAKKIVEMIETRLQKDKLKIQKGEERIEAINDQLREQYSKCFKPQPKNPKAPNDQ